MQQFVSARACPSWWRVYLYQVAEDKQEASQVHHLRPKHNHHRPRQLSGRNCWWQTSGALRCVRRLGRPLVHWGHGYHASFGSLWFWRRRSHNKYRGANKLIKMQDYRSLFRQRQICVGNWFVGQSLKTWHWNLVLDSNELIIHKSKPSGIQDPACDISR
jgi:hypothetical protein